MQDAQQEVGSGRDRASWGQEKVWAEKGGTETGKRLGALAPDIGAAEMRLGTGGLG